MGLSQDKRRSRTSASRLRPRICLRKGCGCVYQPTRWNQRYCQQANCLREVRRWQAAKRQRSHRRLAANRKRHAEAEAQRRRKRKTQGTERDSAVFEERTVQAKPDGAWSRSKLSPGDFCDRPGCYEPLPGDSRAPARYCGGDCRQAVRRVVDRERKWLKRNGYCTADAHGQASQAAWERVTQTPAARAQKTSRGESEPVGDYRSKQQQALSCRAVERHPLPDHERGALQDDHYQANSGRRSRPPPS
jgi:hypothetical protein